MSEPLSLEEQLKQFVGDLGSALDDLGASADVGSYHGGAAKRVGRTDIGIHVTQLPTNQPMFLETEKGHTLNPDHVTKYGIEIRSGKSFLPSAIVDSRVGKLFGLRDLFTPEASVTARTIALPENQSQLAEFTNAILTEIAGRTGLSVEDLHNSVAKSIARGRQSPEQQSADQPAVKRSAPSAGLPA